VRGVGPRVAEMLAAKGITTAEDLLYHLPFRYEDRCNPRSLDELKPGEMASIIGEVRGSALLRTRRMPLFELTLGQGRFAVKCIWFNGSYLQGRFHPGQTVAVFGRVEPSRSTANMKIMQPQFEILPDASDDAETRLLEVGRITPVYESLGGTRLGSRWQRKVIFHMLEGLKACHGRCSSGSTCPTARHRCAMCTSRPKAHPWTACRAGPPRRTRGSYSRSSFFWSWGLS